GIYISSGSACSKGHRSRVLTAMELPNERIDSALRITLSRYTTSDELNMLLKGIAYARQNIRYS
ncbi:MAG: cysteine desulfurase, partial [Oscillospiraceae bacterium]